MKKYGLLVTSPVGPDKNIGDYIQSLAAQQYIPTGEDYEYIEKEDVTHFCGQDKIKCIMNAWYIWHPENWPPQENAIDPLLTSIHITPLTAEAMLANGGKDYFIKHGPVGCRDTGTLDILKKNGVPCYFSGCLTLTLGRKYKYDGPREGVIFVDPYFPPIRYVGDGIKIYYPQNCIKSLWYFLKSPRIVSKLAKNKFFKGRITLQTYYNASMFYHAYSNVFADDLLLNAEYLSHMIPVDKDTTQEFLISSAECLVKKYAKAKMVVTSRIHCALPCTGLETPVIFVLDKMMDSKQNIFNAPGRFGGLIDFFRIASFKNNSVRPVDNDLMNGGEKIGLDFHLANKNNWKEYQSKLIDQSVKFMSR